ncbi:MAG: hypothetical protein R3185_01980 [Candidatus Thermoplasmatota archaeon]|nr:hypothetical protein [Candidatus Thermoplasmatota archaeon]
MPREAKRPTRLPRLLIARAGWTVGRLSMDGRCLLAKEDPGGERDDRA